MPKTEPPHTEEGERALLSCILMDGAAALSKALDAKIVEDCFYNSVHVRVWKSILWLHNHNRPIDLAVLCEELKKKGKMDEIGGYSILADIAGAVPTTAQFGYFLEQVRELYVLRRLIENAESVKEMAMARSGNVEDYVAKTHQILSIRHATQNNQTLEDASNEALDKAQRILKGEQKAEDKGLEWPWADWNKRFGPLQNGELCILGARPGVGKSSSARQCALRWAEQGDVLLFSREMPLGELPSLFAQQMSGASWRHFRRCELFPKQQDQFMDSLRDLVKLKSLHIFDRDRTLAQVTARAKAFQQMKPIRAIIIDYLQRYDPQQERGENRDIALGRMSMAFKDMAVDMKLPVLLLAQVGRGVEKENREPRLSDLRECLSVADSMLFTSQGVWYNADSPMSIVALNSNSQIESADSRNAKRNDAPEMLRITLQSGRFITCTPNHPIMTDIGWVKAKDIDKHTIACTRRIPAPRNTESYPFAKWLGWMLGNGSMVGYSSPSFICSCEDVANAFLDSTESLFGFRPKVHKHACKAVYQYDITEHSVRTPEGNKVKNWLKQNGVWGATAPDKEIPDWFCATADNDSLAELVAGLWETDGCVQLSPRPKLSFSSTSKRMAWQVVWALSRLGVFASIDEGYLGKKANYACYKVSISQAEEIEAFRAKVKLIGKKGRKLASIPTMKPGNSSGSRLSIYTGRMIGDMRRIAGLSHKQLGWRFQNKRISQAEYARISQLLAGIGVFFTGSARLTNPDIYWDMVRNIKKVAGGPVFDRVVPEFHNFVANGIIVHNSGNLEQDADRVIFLHTPEQNKTTGAFQSTTDTETNEIYVEAIQAKGRGEGQHKTELMFHRNTTTFKSIVK